MKLRATKRLFPGRRTSVAGTYSERAVAQGVERPFSVLVQMPQELRSHLAAVLGIRLRPQLQGPEAQAWAVINADLRGIQARSHGPREQLVPLARNHNWWEIIMVAARKLKLQVYPGLSEREVERLVFEETARRVVRRLSDEEILELEQVARSEPTLCNALAGLGLTREGLLLVLAGFGRLAHPRRVQNRKSMSRCVLNYLTHGMQRLGRLQSMGRALRFTHERFHALVVAWTSMEAFWRSLGRPRARFVTVVLAVYFHDLVNEGLDEVDLLKA